MVILVSLVLVANIQMQHQALVRLVQAIVQPALRLLNAEVATLDMVICLAHALSVTRELIQLVVPTLVNHAVPENGQMLETIAVNTVSICLDAKPVYLHLHVPPVKLDMKVMTTEDVNHVTKEHIRRPVVNVLLVLRVNGHFLSALLVKVNLLAKNYS